MLVRSLDSLHSDTVFGVRFSPDGSRLASGAADKFLKVTRVADGKELKSFEGHTHHVLAVDWKSDGKQLVSGGGDNVLKVWDFETGEQLKTLAPAGKQVTAVALGARQADDRGGLGRQAQVRLWNPEKGRPERPGHPHLRPARATMSSASPPPTTAADRGRRGRRRAVRLGRRKRPGRSASSTRRSRRDPQPVRTAQTRADEPGVRSPAACLAGALIYGG